MTSSFLFFSVTVDLFWTELPRKEWTLQEFPRRSVVTAEELMEVDDPMKMREKRKLRSVKQKQDQKKQQKSQFSRGPVGNDYIVSFLPCSEKWLHKHPMTNSCYRIVKLRVWGLMTSPGTVWISGIKVWLVIHKRNPQERQAWNKNRLQTQSCIRRNDTLQGFTRKCLSGTPTKQNDAKLFLIYLKNVSWPILITLKRMKWLF